MESVTIVNIMLAAVLVVGLFAGGAKGLVRQTIELLGLIGSFFIAVLFSGWLADVLQDKVGMPYTPSMVVAFIAILVGGLIAFHFVAISGQRVVRMTFLGWVDRFCGAMLGLIVAMFIASVLVAVTLELPIPSAARRDIESAEVSLFVRPMAPWLFDFVFHRGGSDIAYDKIFRRGGSI